MRSHPSRKEKEIHSSPSLFFVEKEMMAFEEEMISFFFSSSMITIEEEEKEPRPLRPCARTALITASFLPRHDKWPHCRVTRALCHVAAGDLVDNLCVLLTKPRSLPAKP